MRLFPEAIPQRPKNTKHWSMWKKETRDEKPAKVPYQPNGKKAKSNDSSTWYSFDVAMSTFQDIGGFDGICWMMPIKPSGLIFIDIDHCIKNGIIEPWAQQIIDEFDSYTERSQSGNGLHILIDGTKPIRRCRKHGSPFEIYDCLRPCYLTGDVVDAHTTIECRQEPLDRLFGAIFADEMRQASEPQKKAVSDRLSLSDNEVFLKATLAKNGKQFKALWDGITLGYNGDESAADMGLMNMLAFWTGGDADQMERMFSASRRGSRDKWQRRVDYRARTIRTAISDAREFYEPRKEDPKPKGPTVLTALQTLLDNEGKIKGECSWEWRRQKRRTENALKTGYISPTGEQKAHKFLKQFKKILEDLGIDYYDLHPLLLKPKDNKEEFPPEIKAKALDILKNGNPVNHIADSCGEMVLGAETAFKKLTCCISVQNVNQSSGLHPKLTGQSSGGKTWTVYGFAHNLPAEIVIKGSMSAKAGFYHDDGNRVFRILDDYQAGNEDLDTVIKQSTSEFHEPYTHRTVVKQTPATMKIGSEQTWAITSVNNEQDIQVLNRSIPINVDDSAELTKKVNNSTVKRYGEGKEAKPVNETVLVSRCIFQILRDEGYIDVRIPFWERIEWIDTSNRRNPSIFMDLVIAHTAMFRYQREKDSEGYYLATEADFMAAKALFTDKDGEELVKRLTRRERDTLELLIANPEGLTRDDIAEKLKVAPQQVSQILGGRNGQGGLMQKVQIRETKISEMMEIDAAHKRTVHKIVYSLKDYDKFAGFDAVVKLKDDKHKQEPSRKQRNNDESIDESKQNESNEDNESKESKNKNKIEYKREDTSSSSSSLVENILSREKKENAFVAFAKATDDEDDAFVNASSCFHESKTLASCEKIHAAAMMEYGMNGWVDPAKLAHAQKIPLEEVTAWLQANYEAYDRSGGGIGYRQKKAAEEVR